MQNFSFSAVRPRRNALALALRGCAAGMLLWTAANAARAGETPPPEAPSAAIEKFSGPPALVISIDAREPESLPAASEALERLVYDLGRQRRMFSEVSVDPVPDAPGIRQLRLEIALRRLDLDRANLKSWWPPITTRERDGSRVLFSSQLPIEASVKIIDRESGRICAQTTLIAQSKGRTITAGTTETVGILVAQQVKQYLRAQYRRGAF